MRLLVTGASGLLGWNVAQQACQRGWSVVGTRRGASAGGQAPLSWKGEWSWLECDLAAPGAAAQLMRDAAEHDWGPDAGAPLAVVHCAAVADANQVQQAPEQARRVNVDAAAELAAEFAAAAACGGRLLHVSTDLVFDGRSAPYDEHAAPAPLSEYGRQKAEAEREVLGAGGAICRCPLLLGCGPRGPRGALEWLLGRLRSGAAAPLFTDEHRSPLTAPWTARGLLQLAETLIRRPLAPTLLGREGIWHLAGERLSRWELGCLVAEAWGLTKDAIQPVRQSELRLAAPRPADVSMSAQRLRRLGFAAPPLATQLTALAAAGCGGNSLDGGSQ